MYWYNQRVAKTLHTPAFKKKQRARVVGLMDKAVASIGDELMFVVFLRQMASEVFDKKLIKKCNLKLHMIWLKIPKKKPIQKNESPFIQFWKDQPSDGAGELRRMIKTMLDFPELFGPDEFYQFKNEMIRKGWDVKRIEAIEKFAMAGSKFNKPKYIGEMVESVTNRVPHKMKSWIR